jgi:predicted HTH domain antitoxin
MQIESITVQQVFELAKSLSPLDQRLLAAMLNLRLSDSLPEHATIDEAVDFYLADRCSLGRAAELANITRWELIDILKSRDIPIVIDAEFTASEMDDIEKDLEREGLLCS